ncbi:MAG TPA: hypothetical protein VNP03_12195 [Pseudonocardia sp.]|nr:hypothetical protein [Pseudonocardia sp.]
MPFRPRPGLFAITPVLALVAVTVLLISRGWPAYAWWVVLILAGFAVASIRIEYLRWRDLRERERHQAPRR